MDHIEQPATSDHQPSRRLTAAMRRPIPWDEAPGDAELWGDGGITDGQRHANRPEFWSAQRRRVEYTLGNRVAAMVPGGLDKLRDPTIPIQHRAKLAAYLHRWHCNGAFGELSKPELQLVLMVLQSAGISVPAGGGAAAPPRSRQAGR
ncbi:hypothetical protein A6A04_07490 [Paramagnetospirillum marisnigri]|jgi:hypothetical protein|uniref:Uncharacterized protein n=1 Tax=Paramagnetospirillum marisnigri TaxID=1285242 RepID=A0A178M9E9_9PROT|nr:hypothetical protein [Paramagnetospirillum marisnigri]OAN44665.1 hypothetical protein A6A04_07490 [Paramagnetospirillum marisnigri]